MSHYHNEEELKQYTGNEISLADGLNCCQFSVEQHCEQVLVHTLWHSARSSLLGLIGADTHCFSNSSLKPVHLGNEQWRKRNICGLHMQWKLNRNPVDTYENCIMWNCWSIADCGYGTLEAVKKLPILSSLAIYCSLVSLRQSKPMCGFGCNHIHFNNNSTLRS